MDTLKKMCRLLDKKSKISALILLGMIIIGSIAELLGVALILPIVNLAIDDNFMENRWCRLVSELTGLQTREQILLFIIGVTILVYILKNIYLSWMYSKLYLFAANVKMQMATCLMESYLQQPYSFFLRSNIPELIRTVTIDTSQLYEAISHCLLMLSNGFTAILLLITLLVTNVYMTILVAVLLGSAALVSVLVIRKRTHYYGERNQQLSSILTECLQQAFEGIKEVKIVNSERFFINRYKSNYKEQTDMLRKFKIMSLIPKYIIEVVCIIGILLYLAINVIYNPDYISIVQQLAVFVAAAYKLLPSVNAINNSINIVVYNKASIDLVYHDIQMAKQIEEIEEIDTSNGEELVFKEAIQLKNVSFWYKNSDKKILDNVAFSIPKGKSVAFVGPSGGGKTTTADIILSLLSPKQGEVLIDKKNVRDNLEGWRKKIGYIPQNIYLLDTSIKENIALGIPCDDIDEKRVMEAVEKAQLSDFVQALPEGINTKVGERGNNISGGQKQRIGIARALYRNPEILVFDEATSALDVQTEKEVMKAIDSLHGEKTMIMIAHRLSTIENCDIVYTIENGHVERTR